MLRAIYIITSSIVSDFVSRLFLLATPTIVNFEFFNPEFNLVSFSILFIHTLSRFLYQLYVDDTSLF